jgi:hypothetical protein
MQALMARRRHEEPPPPYPRIILPKRQERRYAPVILGQDHSRWTDFYQAMLSAPWWQFLSVLAILYFAVNSVFALLYMLDPGGIENARAYSFRDALFFIRFRRRGPTLRRLEGTRACAPLRARRRTGGAIKPPVRLADIQNCRRDLQLGRQLVPNGRRFPDA